MSAIWCCAISRRAYKNPCAGATSSLVWVGMNSRSCFRRRRTPSAAFAVAGRIDHCIRQPLLVEGMCFRLSASIGIALHPQHGQRRASAALRRHGHVHSQAGQARHRPLRSRLRGGDREGLCAAVRAGSGDRAGRAGFALSAQDSTFALSSSLGSRRWCAGSTRTMACCRQPSSSRSRSAPT